MCHYETIYIKDEYRKQWIGKVNEASNFFKHADRDLKNGKSSIQFNPKISEFHIFEDIRCLRIIEGQDYVYSIEHAVFVEWFMLKYPRLFKKEDHDNRPSATESSISRKFWNDISHIPKVLTLKLENNYY